MSVGRPGTNGRGRKRRGGVIRFALDGIYPLGALAGLLALWALLVLMFDPPQYMVPSPSRVATVAIREWDQLASNMVATTRVALAGLAISVPIGLALGFLTACWPPARRLLLPAIVVTQSIPKIALAPLFVVWFGFGSMPKILIVILITIYPMVVACAVGVASIPSSTLLVARSMGVGFPTLLMKFLLPASAPQLAGAFRVSASFALIGALTAEYVGSSEGIGVVLLTAVGTQNTSLAFAAIILCAVVGSLIYMASTAATRLAAWRLNPEYMRSMT